VIMAPHRTVVQSTPGGHGRNIATVTRFTLGTLYHVIGVFLNKIYVTFLQQSAGSRSESGFGSFLRLETSLKLAYQDTVIILE